MYRDHNILTNVVANLSLNTTDANEKPAVAYAAAPIPSIALTIMQNATNVL